MTGPGDAAVPAGQGGHIAERYGYRTHAALLDLLDFADMAARLVARGRPAYDLDETLRLAAEAITHRIGEAVARLSQDFIADHSQIEWRKIKGMRNIVSHQYAHIDHAIVWNALADRIPATAAEVRGILTGSDLNSS
ncbi:MAG: DUF86 domain-containing protein [Actinobacteria bacterium]|nr:DUF86 domain-containing protein [Actinomycetota bacterium]MBO0786316.1 DUF86 domain-containing protein [Actinomycetota bacterium]